jgi:Golgi SNAP receptor complex protein 2
LHLQLFPKIRKLAYDAKQQLSQLLHNILPVTELSMTLDELTRQLDLLEYELLPKEVPSQRIVWKQKILEVRNDVMTIRKQCDVYQTRILEAQRRDYERNELMQTRRRRVGNVSSNDSNSQRIMNDLADESVSLRNSNNIVGELISIGQDQLSHLNIQRQKMMGIKTSLLRMGNKLGLSHSTMRMIERIDVMDFYLVLAGMIVTSMVLYFVWFR